MRHSARFVPITLMSLLLLRTFTPMVSSAQVVDYPIAKLRILEQSGETGVRVDYLGESQQSQGIQGLNFSNLSFREYLLERLKGYVYHPRFLDFQIQVKLGLLQQLVERSGGLETFGANGNSNTALYGYDIYLHLLKEHPLSALLFANRDRDAVLQLFTDRQLLETERWGASLNWNNGSLPMSLTLSRTKLREFGADSYSESSHTLFDYTVRHRLKDWMDTELRYRHDDFDQNFQAENPIIKINRHTRLHSDELSVLNTIYLGDDRGSYLTSALSMFRQSGTQDVDNLSWQERLNLRHSQNLHSYYLVNMLNNRFIQSTARTWRAEAGLEHKLFQSLRSHFDVHGRWINFEGSSEDLMGVTGRLDYSKRTPWGQLLAGYGRTLDSISRSGGSTSRPILDEALTLSSIRIAFLTEPDVRRETINVTDSSRAVIYSEGFDYTIEVRGNRTGLRVLAGGRLSEGSTVLVNYEINVTQDIKYLADFQTFYLRYQLERYLRGLELFYYWQKLAALDVPAVSSLNILEYTDWRTGFTYNWDWLSWTEEYSSYQSNITSYDQLDSRLDGYHRLDDLVRLGWHAGVLEINYQDNVPGSESYSSILYGSLSLDGRFGHDGYWNVEAQARKESGLVKETLLGLAGRVGTHWRKLRLSTGFRVEQLDQYETNRNRYQGFMEIAREF